MVQREAEGLDSRDGAVVFDDLNRDEETVQCSNSNAIGPSAGQVFELQHDVPIVLEHALGVHFLGHVVADDLVVGDLILGSGIDAELVRAAEAHGDKVQQEDDRIERQYQRDQVTQVPSVRKELPNKTLDAALTPLQVPEHVAEVQSDVIHHQDGVNAKVHQVHEPQDSVGAAPGVEVEGEGLRPAGLDHLSSAQQAEAHHAVGEHVHIAVISEPIENHRG
mmetsp:Transcript_127051/g.329622  ORF Transcript_127051/g.329622 Transcript_127051/m.329622 type:complete len:221 (+) Transcript_127051:1798-2460(+)